MMTKKLFVFYVVHEEALAESVNPGVAEDPIDLRRKIAKVVNDCRGFEPRTFEYARINETIKDAIDEIGGVHQFDIEGGYTGTIVFVGEVPLTPAEERVAEKRLQTIIDAGWRPDLKCSLGGYLHDEIRNSGGRHSIYSLNGAFDIELENLR